MTIGQKIFYLLEKKGMTQKAFSDKTGIATTTICDWRKKNTNPGSDKILVIAAALDLTADELLSGVAEDSERGRASEYMVVPKGTEERMLLECYGALDFADRDRLMAYAKKLAGMK